ncbi:CBS domain-containing protein [Streptomyces malaysiensis]|uniref:CBS domain-containing protein n=1 Tax=Streptomyces malaysiensis TaxID=92644 RepID=UPI0032207C0C|nr:CBS domain-containing protein [Streptomyces malaysiensis]
MTHRTVGQVMTTAVVHVRPDASFKEILNVLVEHDLTAVPVLDDQNRPLGVVSDADLLSDAAGKDVPGGWALTARPSPDAERDSRVKDAAGLMRSPAVCAASEWTVCEAARVMGRRGVDHLVVVDEAGRTVGIVGRGDLLRGFLRRDRAIAEDIRREVMARSLGLPRDALEVRVDEGEVSLSGVVERRSTASVLVRLCGDLEGVVAVTDRLGYRADDTHPAVATGVRTERATGSRCGHRGVDTASRDGG